MAGETYRSAGVDIDAGEQAVDAIRDAVRSTYRPEVLGDIGSFGGLFSMPDGYDDPVLVAATDGVGTKIQVARAMDRWDTIGLDLVAMCVDDLVCQGAEPLFFLDYLSAGRLDRDRVAAIVGGIADGCRQAGCALIGGEMAEHPGVMDDDDVELVGFAVGVVDRDRVITPTAVRPGDALVALDSPGLRSNGYSLARRVFLERAGRSLDAPAFDGAATTLGDELLAPSVIYAPAIAAIRREVDVRSIAHITGGGIPGNLNRALPLHLDAEVDTGSWEPPRIFSELAALGDVSDEEMANVFNLGVGMIVVVAEEQVLATIEAAVSTGRGARRIGQVVPGEGSVRLVS
jgi:phosphoribosylformylglycinamidine cyclo-ligase